MMIIATQQGKVATLEKKEKGWNFCPYKSKGNYYFALQQSLNLESNIKCMQGNDFEAKCNLEPWCNDKFNFEKKLKIIQFSFIRIWYSAYLQGILDIRPSTTWATVTFVSTSKCGFNHAGPSFWQIIDAVFKGNNCSGLLWKRYHAELLIHTW